MWFAQTEDISPTYYNDYYPTTTTVDESTVVAIMIAYYILILVFAVIYVIALWKIFTKAGIPGWKAVVPFYNNWTFCEMVGKPGWWSLLYFVPIAGLVVFIITSLELGKAFNKDAVWSVFLLIVFSIIGYLILAFGGDKYDRSRLSSSYPGPTNYGGPTGPTGATPPPTAV